MKQRRLNLLLPNGSPCSRGTTDGEYVFCLLNDGSTDDSPAILNTLAKEYPELHIIDKRNTGHGPSCMDGYRKALESDPNGFFRSIPMVSVIRRSFLNYGTPNGRKGPLWSSP